MNQIKKFMNTLSANIHYDSIENKIKFDDLNGDCIIHIIENLNLKDLISMAQVNSNIYYLAIDVFRRKFSKKRIVIYNYFVEDEPKEDMPGFIKEALIRLGFFKKRLIDPVYNVYDESIEILKDSRMSLDLLKLFGSFVKSLKLVIANAELSGPIKLIQCVNKHCSKSLIDLELEISGGNTFQYIKIPFLNLEHLSLRDFIPNIGKNDQQMNQHFPALRTLSVTPLRMIGNYIICHLPNLEHLIIDMNYCDVIDEFLKNNSHVKSIELTQATSQSLQSVNAKLSNLVYLKVGEFDMMREEIQFDNVKKFIAKNACPKNITFPKLQELRVQFESCRFEDWIFFLKNHKQLNHFQLQCCDKEEELTMVLPNLAELSILRFDAKFTKNSIFKAKKHNRFMKIILDACEKKNYEVFHEKFEFKWEIQNFCKGLSLEQT